MESETTTDTASSDKKQPLFQELNADQDPEVTEIESLCMRCGENGITKLLLTKIPFYKEVVIMSFLCNHCHWENNELQPAAKIQEKGVTFTLKAQNPKDLGRVVVKTEWASIVIPELEFEIPAQSQEGTVSTVEGIIERACSGLSHRIGIEEDPEAKLKIAEFLDKLSDLRLGNTPFTFVLQDCSGNSFVQNLCAPAVDPQLEITYYERSREECLLLGIYSENDNEPDAPVDKSDLKDEVLGFPTNCHGCNAPCMTNMKLIQIPHFKDVVIMATNCDACGQKTNEVKSASGIEPLGIKMTLKVESVQDLKRDVLKSDTCSVSVKELELEAGSGAFGSRYTTVEGIFVAIKEQLMERNPLFAGDSTDPSMKENMEKFFQKIDEIIAGKLKATLVLDDPCGNSYLQSTGNPDANLTIEKYERSQEQKEELGLLDMKVENYEES